MFAENSNHFFRNSIQQVIPAASAIAGRVSASQELPYMTPPIVQPQQQYFSGDSQDSSSKLSNKKEFNFATKKKTIISNSNDIFSTFLTEGYTSISVREPLANIIAQTKKQNAHIRRREISDSHYATVSDDSDEMYAAIEDPNNPVELYTSGSETYAQIQPQESMNMVVSVEINPVPSQSHPHSINNNTPAPSAQSSLTSHSIATPSSSLNATTTRNSMNEPTVDMLKAAAHSRQASSSSCTSSVGNLGSPKPEKRQANSPLPPTPKGTHHYQSNSSLANPLSLQSGRNSAASVIEVGRQVSRENLSDNRNHLRSVHGGGDDEPRKNRLSKDLEGMYAKVMKKNKLSTAPSENTSPVPIRKVLNEQQQQQQPQTPQQQHQQSQQPQQPQSQRQSLFLSDPDIAREINSPDALSKSIHTSPGKNSIKSAQLHSDDNDYETIDKRRARSSSSNYDSKNDPGYETIPADLHGGANKSNSNRNSSHAPAPPGELNHFANFALT